LAHISDVKVSRLAVKTVAPGVSQTIGPDFIAPRGRTKEGIGGRARISAGRFRNVYITVIVVIARNIVGPVNVDTQHLSQELIDILTVANGAVLIIESPAVARCDIEISIRAECDPSAIMVAFCISNAQENGSRVRGYVWIPRNLISCNRVGAAYAGRVIHEEHTVGGVIGVKRQPKQPLFAPRNYG
jgi:hypothetical protein